MDILVTGATGFLGRHVLPLLRDRRVRVLLDPEDTRRDVLIGAGVEVVEASILDENALEYAMRDVRLIFHLAGLVNGARESAEDYERINYQGAANVAFAAYHSKAVQQVIFSSSVTVYGTARFATEASPLLPQSGYAKSKYDAELILRGLLQDRLTILRLPGLFGVGDYGTMLPTVEALRKLGVTAIFGSGREPWSVLAAHDAARAFQFVSDCPRAWGQTFNVVGGLTTNGEILRRMGRVVGCKAEVRLPTVVAELLVEGGKMTGHSVLTREQVRGLSTPLAMDGSKLAALGFELEANWQMALEGGAVWALRELDARKSVIGQRVLPVISSERITYQ